MLSRYFFQISERKFDRTRKHIRWICLRVIANLQLKFGEKTRNPFFYLAFCNSKYILSIYNYPARIGCAQDIADGQFSLNFQR